MENLSHSGNDYVVRQERLKQELSKLHFDFKTNCLDLPAGSGSKDFLHMDQELLDGIESTEASMGKDLD